MDWGALAAVGAFFLSIVAFVVAQRANRRIATDARRREVVDPLLFAASDLQSRLWNILRPKREPDAAPTGDDLKLASEYTVFVFAQYFGWWESVRRTAVARDIRMPRSRAAERIGDVASRGRPSMAIIGREISDALRKTSEFGTTLRVSNGEQHAIGGAMFRWEMVGDARVPDVLRFDEFIGRLHSDPEFRAWFGSIEDGVTTLLIAPEQHSEGRARLELVQSLLVALIDTLDPRHEIFRPREPLIGTARLRAALDDALR
ncbi:hypothetical protein ACGGZK_06885 [Agromyces sp. MMS24-K17]|uniref:hypothetical protein n=1 Tax=Agromyces sp. MMS24-K17 TaxID=3372850 RepID=UPI003754FD90